MQFLEGFFVFLYLGSLPKCEFIADFRKNWSLLEGIFHFDLYLRGTLIFFFKKGLSSSLFLKNAAGGFRPVEWGFIT